MVSLALESSRHLLTGKRMIDVSDAYSIEDLREMDEDDMRTILKYYKDGKVPRFACLKAMKGDYDAFDGSFGFFVGG